MYSIEKYNINKFKKDFILEMQLSYNSCKSYKDIRLKPNDLTLYDPIDSFSQIICKTKNSSVKFNKNFDLIFNSG